MLCASVFHHYGCNRIETSYMHLIGTCPAHDTNQYTRNQKPLKSSSESEASDLDEEHLRSSTSGLVGVESETLDEDISSALESTTSQNDTGSNIDSRSTIDSLEALELVKAHLLNDNRLQFLLPQVILKYHSAEQRTCGISRLILRYSCDLQALAEKRIDGGAELASLSLSTATCLQRERRRLVEEICAHYWLQGLQIRDPGVKPFPTRRRCDRKPGAKDSADTKNKPIQADKIARATEFLFTTEPFDQFKKLVQAKAEENVALPFSIRALDLCVKTAHNLAFRLHEPRSQPQVKRLYWRCVSAIDHVTQHISFKISLFFANKRTQNCGWKSYDDYLEILPGAIEKLKAVLSSYGIRSVVSGDIESPPSQEPSSRACSSQAKANKHFDIRLPSQWQHHDSGVPGTCRPQVSPNSADTAHNYLLACAPFGRWVSKVYQAEVCTINSDQDFFSLLRLLYHGRQKLRRPLSWFFRIKAIHFVQVGSPSDPSQICDRY